jgi:hypothetical protein
MTAVPMNPKPTPSLEDLPKRVGTPIEILKAGQRLVLSWRGQWWKPFDISRGAADQRGRVTVR